MTPSIAVCLGFRNWHLLHLQRCLASLHAQRPYAAVFDQVVVVDLGSDDDTADAVQECVLMGSPSDGRTDCSIWSHPRPEWSRSIALNQAARVADQVGSDRSGRTPPPTHYLFTDADMIFPDDYLDRLLIALAAWTHRDRTLLLTRSRDTTPQSVADLDGMRSTDPPFGWAAMTLLANTSAHPDTGQGGGMVIPVDWFRRVGGFDEFYRVWGAEDQDLVDRARWDGLTVEWVPDAFVVHQWHRRDWPTESQYQVVEANRAYYAARLRDRDPIVRNG